MPDPATSGSSISRVPFDRIDSGKGADQVRQCQFGIGKRSEFEIRIEQSVACGCNELQPKRGGGVFECGCRHRGKIVTSLRRTLHETLQPRIFELLSTPQLRQRGPATGEQALCNT